MILDATGEAVGLSIACAVVPFQIVLLSSTSAMRRVSLREPILLNRRFDRMLMPPSAVLTETLAFAASFVMFPLMMAIYWRRTDGRIAVACPWSWRRPRCWRWAWRGPRRCSGVWAPNLQALASSGAAHPVLRRPGPRRAVRGLGRASYDWIVFNPLSGLFEVVSARLPLRRRPRVLAARLSDRLGLLLMALFLPLYRREQRHFAKLVTSL